MYVKEDVKVMASDMRLVSEYTRTRAEQNVTFFQNSEHHMSENWTVPSSIKKTVKVLQWPLAVW